MNYLALATLVIAWCFLHSVLISIPVTEYLHRRLGSSFRFYRLCYNMISALSLVPVIIYASSVRTAPVFHWDGHMVLIRAFLLGTAALLFFLGAKRYDAAQLLGFKQIREGTSNQGISAAGGLDTSGILGIIRHPWYLAAMLLIWARTLDISTILVNTILTSYLIIGTYLEEQKLVREFGEEYRLYQQRVSMLLPYKWLRSIFTK